jgi:hypothetical protein
MSESMNPALRPEMAQLPTYKAGKKVEPVNGLTAFKLSSNEVSQAPLPSVVAAIVDAASETDPAGGVSAGTEIHTLYHLHANAAGNAKIEFALVSTTDKNSSAKETITLEVEVKAAASK